MTAPYLIGTQAATSVSTVTISLSTLGTTTSATDAIIVFAATSNTGSNQITSVNDSQGNTYGRDRQESAQYNTAIFTATGETTALGTSDTIIVHFAASGSCTTVAVGCANAATVDISATNNGGTSGGTVASGALTVPAEVVFACFTGAHLDGNWTWSGAFTHLGTSQTSSTQYLSCGYDIVASTSSVTATAANTGEYQWASVLVSIELLTGKSGTASLGAVAGLTAAGYVPGAAVLSEAATLSAKGGNPDGVNLPAVSSLTAAGSPTIPGSGVLSATSTLSAAGGNPDQAVVNQWASSAASPIVWGNSPPGSTQVAFPLTHATSVGGGTGIASEGNWLFAFCGWNTSPSAPTTTVNVGDDLHDWWRPAPPSSTSGGTRTTIWYTPNIQGSPQYVYVAPSGYVDGMAVLVIEVSGLGPWDVVTGINTAYVNTGTMLSLALGTPAAETFFVAAVTGDSTTAGTTIGPTGWTPLSKVTGANGTDHTSDVVLAPACISTTTSVSIAGHSTTAENLSGMVIGVLTSALPPVPANQSWPLLVCEAAFGAGYQTPPDQMTWTPLQPDGLGVYRLRGWQETTGIQYELDALQSSEGTLILDNPDGAMSPFNPSSPYYPDVVPGTPIRIRAVAPGGTRWYVIQRNVERWPQSWDETFRGLANTTVNDLWSVANRLIATCYRAEVLADQPYAWWPCDDPNVGFPTRLLNQAPANSNPLNISTAPGGLSSASIDSEDTSYFFYNSLQSFAQSTGWMYGDSVSSSWKTSGSGLTTTGRYLSCHDTSFPALSGVGVTVEGWWNYEFSQTISSDGAAQGAYGQPQANLVLWELATATGPVAVLFLDTSGHLNFTAGSTTTSIYTGGDLRNTTWFGVTVTMTQTTWTVWLNGGILAKVTGTATMGSSFTYFLANAGTGSSGGGTTSAVTGVGNAEISHLAIYPRVLPPARVMAHFMAAYTAFGQMPAPQSCSFKFIASDDVGSVGGGPDGNFYTGTFFSAGLSTNPSGVTVVGYVTSAAGTYTSVPQPVEGFGFVEPSNTNTGFMWADTTGLAPEYKWYTSAASAAEQLAATTVGNYLYIDGYGSGTTVPFTATALGDTAQQRLERIALAGGITTPARCIDPSSTAIVAELDTGGQASGTAMSNIAASDGGLLFVDNTGCLCYFQRSHLAAQPVRWQLGENVNAGQSPYLPDAEFDTDPQQVKNDIEVTQYNVSQAVTAGSEGLSTGSGEASGGLVYAPAAAYAAAVVASQAQYGNSQFQATSYLQNTTLIQNQADWVFENFGTAQQRITNLTVEAAGTQNILRWEFVLGVNVGDVIQVQRTPPGQPYFSGVWRVTHIDREISFADGTAKATVIADYYPPAYWDLSGPDAFPSAGSMGMEDEAGLSITDETGGVMS